MAHYIAELMVEAQKVPPDHAEDVRTRCFNCILQLWRHLADQGRVRADFETYNELINTLQRLSSSDRSFYFDHTGKPRNESLEQVRQIDSAARAIVMFLLAKTAEGVGEREDEWIDLAQRLPADAQGNVPLVILKMRALLIDGSDEEDGEDERQKLIERAKSGVAHLRAVLVSIEEGLNEAERKSAEEKE